MELYEKGKEQNRQYAKGMRTTPIEPEFTPDYFFALIDERSYRRKEAECKGVVDARPNHPGTVGNAIAQDILFRVRLHPRHPIVGLSTGQTSTVSYYLRHQLTRL